MATIGKLVSVWRFPVKGMKGEELQEGFISFSGVYGDRIYAFRCSTAPAGFPYHTAREQEDLLLYEPRFRTPAAAKAPPNLVEADATAPGATPIYGERTAFAVDVVGPNGVTLPIDSADLLTEVRESRDDDADIHLAYSERSLTDCRPISVFNLATVSQLSTELGFPVDYRAFRANMYFELDDAAFAENKLVGRNIRVGEKAVITILERDPRCKMIGLDPDTGKNEPRILQHVVRTHEGKVGVYAAVLVEGVVRPGDPIELMAAGEAFERAA